MNSAVESETLLGYKSIDERETTSIMRREITNVSPYEYTCPCWAGISTFVALMGIFAVFQYAGSHHVQFFSLHFHIFVIGETQFSSIRRALNETLALGSNSEIDFIAHDGEKTDLEVLIECFGCEKAVRRLSEIDQVLNEANRYLREDKVVLERHLASVLHESNELHYVPEGYPCKAHIDCRHVKQFDKNEVIKLKI